MRSKVIGFGRLGAGLWFLLSLQLAHGAGVAVPPQVEYDREHDRLSMAVEGASLKAVLQQVAKQSALEVLFDDAADSTLSLTLKEVSLDEGVKRILKGSNHALRYNKNAAGTNLLIGVIVMPAGQQNSARAHPLVPQGKEAYHFASQQKAAVAGEGAERPTDWSNERWQARLDQMPAELRERLEKQAAKRLAMEEKGKERDKRREEREKARQEQGRARMNAHIPEAEQQKIKERQQQFREKIKEQLPNREQYQSKPLENTPPL